MLLTIAETGYWTIFGTVVFIGLSGLLTLIILIQKPKGGGLAGAFGGAGGSQQAVFGAKTGDVLTWVTVFLFVAFVFTAMCLVWLTRSDAEIKLAEPAVISTPVDGLPDMSQTDLESAVETAVETTPAATEAATPEAAPAETTTPETVTPETTTPPETTPNP